MAIEGKKFSELTAQQKADMRDEMRGYKVYRAYITTNGSGEQEPTIIVFENTIDANLIPVYGGVGTVNIMNLTSFSGYYIGIDLRDIEHAFINIDGSYSLEIRFNGIKEGYAPSDVEVYVQETSVIVKAQIIILAAD